MHGLFRSSAFLTRQRWLCCVLLSSQGCDSKLIVGMSTCPATASSIASAGGSALGTGASSAFAPWSTGFENGFCDYSPPAGFCYSHDSAEFQIVDQPVHSGRHAAAFSVRSGDDTHTRCYREGTLPKEAFYSAWYYVPALSKNRHNWNLIHFQQHRGSSVAADALTHTWDVSLVNDASGALRLNVWTALPGVGKAQGESPPVPIGKWFEITVYLKLAADNSGEVAVYQDGNRYLEFTSVATDFSDSEWGQWYVGNLADDLDPPNSTLYVDDVSVRTPG